MSCAPDCCAAAEPAASLVTYPQPAEVTYTHHNDDFTVKVRTPGGRWQDLYEYDVKVDLDKPQDASMVYFDFSGAVEVSVRKNNGDVRSARIRPASYGIQPVVRGNTVYFRLTQPRKLSIEFNGDRLHNLHVLAHPLKDPPPEATDPNVLYFGPGVHQPPAQSKGVFEIPSGKTVYIAGSAILRGKLLLDHVHDVRIVGRGMIESPENAIEVDHSSRIHIAGVIVKNPTHYTVQCGGSDHLEIDDLTTFSAAPWSDGIDMMSCSDVTIHDVFLRTSDDAIAIYGHRWGFFGDSRHVRVTDSVLWADIAHPMNIGLHGDSEGKPETIEDIEFRNIDVLEHDEDDPEYQGCMAISAGDSNLVRNVTFDDIRVDDFQEGKLFNLRVVFNKKYNTSPGRGIDNVTFRNISYTGDGASPSVIGGLDAQRRVRHVRFENVSVNGRQVLDPHDADIDVGDFVDDVRFTSTASGDKAGGTHGRTGLDAVSGSEGRAPASGPADRAVASGAADRAVASGAADRAVASGAADRAVASGPADRRLASGSPVRDAPWIPDLGNGRYRNPVLAADYSDPDVVRVGSDYYLTSSSFTNVPGLPILHSKDLVNWTLIGHALPRLMPDAHYATPRRGGGVWAPAIRYHDGRFYIYYPDPDFGIYVTTAERPQGPWSPPVLVDASRGAIDPCPFWDEDGSAWLIMAWAKSRAGFNNVLTLKRLSPDGMKVLDAGTVVVDGGKLTPAQTSQGPLDWEPIEGPKLYKENGWYMIFAPAGGVRNGWQSVFRSRKIEGPYEARVVMDQGRSATNGPHQGAWVRTARGEDWFVHFQDTDAYGRRVHLQPMHWKNGWPVIGLDPDGDGRGEPVQEFRKPLAGAPHAPAHGEVPAPDNNRERVASPELAPVRSERAASAEVALVRSERVGEPITVPQMTDEFDGPLSLAWQWSANPQEDWMSLDAAPGWLRLSSISSSRNLYEAGNLLTQKFPGPVFTATTRMRFEPRALGERAGLLVFGNDYAWVGLTKTAAGLKLVQVVCKGADVQQPEIQVAEIDAPDNLVYLRLHAEPEMQPLPATGASAAGFSVAKAAQWPSGLRLVNARISFSYSLDGIRFTPFGQPFVAVQGRWVGAVFGLFAQAPTGTPASAATSVGHADFDWFRVTQ